MTDYPEIPEDILESIQVMSPTLYQYYKGLEERRIVINDALDNDIIERVALPLIEMDNDGTGAPIDIVLSSPGGSVFDAMVLCDIIDRLKTPTTITVMGYAYSMGSIILMAGFNNENVKKVRYPFPTALVHSGSTYMEGAANIVKDTFHFTQRFEELIKSYILSHSYITEEEYNKMERYEWYMLADDILRLGLVDEVL